MREERACPGGCWVITPRSLCPVVPCPNSVAPQVRTANFQSVLLGAEHRESEPVEELGLASRERAQNEGSKEFFDIGQVGPSRTWETILITLCKAGQRNHGRI